MSSSVPASATHGSITWAQGSLGSLSSDHRHHQQKVSSVWAWRTHGSGFRHKNVAQVTLGVPKIFKEFCAWKVWWWGEGASSFPCSLLRLSQRWQGNCSLTMQGYCALSTFVFGDIGQGNAQSLCFESSSSWFEAFPSYIPIHFMSFWAPGVKSPEPPTWRRWSHVLALQVLLILTAEGCCPRVPASTAVA